MKNNIIKKGSFFVIDPLCKSAEEYEKVEGNRPIRVHDIMPNFYIKGDDGKVYRVPRSEVAKADIHLNALLVDQRVEFKTVRMPKSKNPIAYNIKII